MESVCGWIQRADREPKSGSWGGPILRLGLKRETPVFGVGNGQDKDLHSACPVIFRGTK